MLGNNIWMYPDAAALTHVPIITALALSFSLRRRRYWFWALALNSQVIIIRFGPCVCVRCLMPRFNDRVSRRNYWKVSVKTAKFTVPSHHPPPPPRAGLISTQLVLHDVFCWLHAFGRRDAFESTRKLPLGCTMNQSYVGANADERWLHKRHYSAPDKLNDSIEAYWRAVSNQDGDCKSAHTISIDQMCCNLEQCTYIWVNIQKYF